MALGARSCSATPVAGQTVRVGQLLLVLGAVLTVGGAVLLVVAFRRGQDGRRDGERRAFRLAVAGLAAGSLLFLATVVLAP